MGWFGFLIKSPYSIWDIFEDSWVKQLFLSQPSETIPGMPEHPDIKERLSTLFLAILFTQNFITLEIKGVVL